MPRVASHAAERPDVRYSLVAVDFLPPAVIGSTLAKVARQLASGVLAPLRSIAHRIGSAAAAFRQMIQASHVGKVVVSAERSGSAPPATQPRSLPCLAITGGSGGLALLITQWLVQRSGPAYIRLLSRSGWVADAAMAAGLATSAACVTSAKADAGSPADAAAVLAAGSGQGAALQAVMHTAGVLADSLVNTQTAGSFRWALHRLVTDIWPPLEMPALPSTADIRLCRSMPCRRVFAPKLGGLGALSTALQQQPLNSLVLFSSMASLLGAAGQVG